MIHKIYKMMSLLTGQRRADRATEIWTWAPQLQPRPLMGVGQRTLLKERVMPRIRILS